jgi:uncharacterized protein YbcI
MTDPQDIPEQVTASIGSIWNEYAGKAPSDVRTTIRDNVVTCVLIDAVAAFERGMAASRAAPSKGGSCGHTARGYKQEAVGAVVRLTGKGVAAFASSHDCDTDVATEVFTLKPPPPKKAGAGKQFAHAFWLTPLPPCRVEDPL